MHVNHRLRRLLIAVATVALALVFVACAQEYPNTTFQPRTEFGRTIDDLWNRLLFWGIVVFVIVELALLYVIFRYRRREGAPEPRDVHGNTLLEVAWTLIPAIILFFIAVPTVRAIFTTQREAEAGSLQVEVIGHQWWWEFRYPQYDVVTANELYLPTGRTVNFALTTRDVVHSFWIPQMGGKRDLITNRTNYLWFTPDTGETGAWNGFCAEYCGESHANMRFRAFTVTEEDFERWIQHQRSPAAIQPDAEVPGFSAGEVPSHTIPSTPLPRIPFDTALVGDPERGRQTYSTTACIGCHAIRGNPSSVGTLGPSLTHFGSRLTLGAGLYPNERLALALWIKNAPALKPGSLMPPQGQGQHDPGTGIRGTLTDQQIADIVAYLQALK